MTLTHSLEIVQTDLHRIEPQVAICAATGTQAELARPWATMSGQSDFEVVQFRDGGGKHAPELVDDLREMFHATDTPSLLIFAHRGHQIECMMPLLPSLLHAIDYRGPAQAIRMREDESDAETQRKIKRFALGQLPIGGHAVLVEDRQDRIGPKGALRPGLIEVSRLVLLSAPQPLL